MEEKSLIARDATTSDLPLLWDIVHAEGLPQSPEQLNASLSVLRVLCHGAQIVGVRGDGWQAFHPLVPDRATSALWDQLESLPAERPSARRPAASNATVRGCSERFAT